MDINAIIDNLCNKLGTTAELIIPEYAKMKIAIGITQIIICAVLIAAVAIGAKKVQKWMRENEIGQYDDEFVGVGIFMGSIVSAVVVVACVLRIVCDIESVVRFTTSPEAAFVEEMLSKIK